MHKHGETFTIPNVWSGVDYELKIYLGAPSEARLRLVLRRIWQQPKMEGPFLDRDREPTRQDAVPPDTVHDKLFGLANVSDSALPCGTFIVREEDTDGQRRADFISLYIPLGALSLIYPIGSYPFGDVDQAAKWRYEVDTWLLEFLSKPLDNFEFEIAVIGWEPELTLADVEKLKESGVPAERYDGIVLPSPSGVQWYPPTRHDPVTLDR